MDNLYPSFKVLLVDDEAAWLRSLRLALELNAGITHVEGCCDSRLVMGLLETNNIGLVLLDLTMPHISGEELLTQILEQHPEVTVGIISGLNQLECAVRCIKQGAFDYFVKTDPLEHIIKGILQAIRMRELHCVNREMQERFLSQTLQHPEAFAGIVTVNPTMRGLFQYLESVGPSSQPVLITGESGVGKELFSRAAHTVSQRKGPLVSVNVAGLDDNSFSDSLFGHTAGAFTGATRPRSGMVEQSQGGTLFLDEIGDLSLLSQVKLLRLLQGGEYYPLGSDRPKRLQARIVVATNQNLEAKVKDGSFRKDLYYRLHIHQVNIPPLRQRKDDLPPLLNAFLEEAAIEFGKKKPTLPKELLAHLSNYSFPGNVRELRGMVFDAVGRHNAGVLSLQAFQRIIDKNMNVSERLQGDTNSLFAGIETLPTLTECLNLLVDEAIERSKGNQTLAARMLGISQPALSKRLKNTREEK